MGKYNYLIVGAGLYGGVMVAELTRAGKSCLVVEKRPVIGGNVRTETVEGVQVHRYGPHVFNTNNQQLWDYVNRWTTFRHQPLKVKARAQGRLYSFPVNLMTMNQLWGVTTPKEAQERLKEERVEEPGDNLRAHALRTVGKRIYELFVEGYTAKQWGKDPRDLPASLWKRVPVRMTYNDDYHDARWQGLPEEGYTVMVERMLSGSTTVLAEDYCERREFWDRQAERTVYAGPLDRLFKEDQGKLEYRSLRFEWEKGEGDRQGCPVLNHTDRMTPYTRVMEYKHFMRTPPKATVLAREYPADYNQTNEPYYPVPTEENRQRAELYKKRAQQEGILLGGRLGTYNYYNMDQVVAQALTHAKRLIEGVEC